MTVFMVLVSVVLLAIVLGMIGLFAMMGELVRRVDSLVGDEANEDSTREPIIGARIGETPRHWPEEMARLQYEDSLVIVLSTLCTTCGRVADRLDLRRIMEKTPVAIAISCSSQESGLNFAQQHGLLGQCPIYTDVLGDWLMRSLAIDISPSALIFRQGTLEEAWSFTSHLALIDILESEGRDKTDVAAPGK